MKKQLQRQKQILLEDKRTSNATSAAARQRQRKWQIHKARAMLRLGNLVEGFSTFRWIDSVSGVGYRRFSVLLHNFPTIKY
jgi:hypothetical protein